MQKKTFLSLAVIVLACVLLVGACIYLFPTKTTPLNTTLEATKLDSDGNVLGTTQIPMQGAFKKYLIKDSMMELSIASFDGIKNIIFYNDYDHFGFKPIAFDTFYRYSGTAWENASGEMLWVHVFMSQDFEYWAFRMDVHNSDENVYYVASLSGERTVEEIVQYFKGLVPGYKAP